MGATDKQAMFDRAATAHQEQVADERAAGLPAGALGVEALNDINLDELTDSEIVQLVADVFDLSILGAVERLSKIDFDVARTLAEAN